MLGLAFVFCRMDIRSFLAVFFRARAVGQECPTYLCVAKNDTAILNLCMSELKPIAS